MFDSIERGVVESLAKVENSNHTNYAKVIEAVNSGKRKTVVLVYVSVLPRMKVTFIVSISYPRSEKKPISLY